MRDLYDEDVLLWSERQAALLRRVAAGERVNDHDLDWPNIIQALLHSLKARAWPRSPAVPGWEAEARRFRGQARRRFTPSMRHRLDLAGLYEDALRAMPATIDGRPAPPVPASCPTALDDLLGRDG